MNLCEVANHLDKLRNQNSKGCGIFVIYFIHVIRIFFDFFIDVGLF